MKLNTKEYCPAKVYVVRDKNGNFAVGLKIYPSKSGASKGRNAFINRLLNQYCIEEDNNWPEYNFVDIMWHVFSNDTDKNKRITFEDFSTGRFSQYFWAKNITQKHIDKYYQAKKEIAEEWHVEEIKQSY